MLLSGDDACAPKLYSLRILNSPRGFGCSCPRTKLRSFVFTPFLPFRSVAVAHQARFASAYPLLLATQSLPENTHTHIYKKKTLHASLKYLRSARLSCIRNLTKQTQATALFILSE